MTVEMTETRPKATESDISEFESARSIQLPRSYRRFLLQTNGGRPRPSTFPVAGMSHTKTWGVGVFFGIGGQHPANEVATAYDTYAGGFPAGIIPIAGDDMGNYVCLDVRKGTDRVAFWDKRHFWGTGEWREVDFYHVADSFDEFLASLRPAE